MTKNRTAILLAGALLLIWAFIALSAKYRGLLPCGSPDQVAACEQARAHVAAQFVFAEEGASREALDASQKKKAVASQKKKADASQKKKPDASQKKKPDASQKETHTEVQPELPRASAEAPGANAYGSPAPSPDPRPLSPEPRPPSPDPRPLLIIWTTPEGVPCPACDWIKSEVERRGIACEFRHGAFGGEYPWTQYDGIQYVGSRRITSMLDTHHFALIGAGR